MSANPFLSRRTFLAASSAAAAAVLARTSDAQEKEPGPEPFKLPDLPWAPNALEPTISSNTLAFHHGQHHRTYVANLNKLVQGKDWARMELGAVVTAAHAAKETAVFNNAAQAWNHAFYWKSLAPTSTDPVGKFAARIAGDLGSLEACKKALAEAAKTQFGSGWAWLVEKDGKLEVVKTPNADSPLLSKQKALLTIDVWEHAYYLDHQNRRGDYVDAIVERHLNWEFAAANLG